MYKRQDVHYTPSAISILTSSLKSLDEEYLESYTVTHLLLFTQTLYVTLSIPILVTNTFFFFYTCSSPTEYVEPKLRKVVTLLLVRYSITFVPGPCKGGFSLGYTFVVPQAITQWTQGPSSLRNWFPISISEFFPYTFFPLSTPDKAVDRPGFIPQDKIRDEHILCASDYSHTHKLIIFNAFPVSRDDMKCLGPSYFFNANFSFKTAQCRSNHCFSEDIFLPRTNHYP